VQAKHDEEPAQYLIRGNPVFNGLVPGFRRDDVWIPSFAGMTMLMAHSPIMTQSIRGNEKVLTFYETIKIDY
jgi:hypothetical protein